MPFDIQGGFIPLTFTVGTQVIERKLVNFGVRIEDMSPVWEQIGEDLLADFASNFADEGGVFGQGAWAQWAPLAQSTIADRLRRGYDAGPILERTGQLRQSTTERGTPGNVFIVAANGVEVGTLTPYAKYHQSGTRRMPKRVIVGLTPERMGWTPGTSVLDRLRTYIAQQWQAQA